MKGVLAFLAACLAASSGLADLPRRASLGVAIAPNPGGEGLKIVQSLTPGNAFKPEDIMLSIDGRPVTGPQGKGPTLQLYGRKIGSTAKVRISRGGTEQELDIVLVAAPPPVLDGQPVELGVAQAKGGPRVRTYLSLPIDKKLARKGRLPLVMVLPGIPCGTVETFASANHPYTKLFREFNAAGIAAAMADKPGQGDSEGTRCEEGGFDVEEAAFRAAAKVFTQDKRIDPKRFFVIGLSLGGIQAPLVAETAPAAGIVTWGTGVMPWHDYLLTTFHRRDVMQGESPDAALAQATSWRKVLSAIFVQKKSLPEIARDMPADYKAVSDWAGDISQEFAGRAWVFHTEIDRAPVVRAWNAHKGKLLALHGEYDWVAERHDHQLSADIVNRNRPGDASFETIPGVDHAMTRHASRADSFAKFGQGAPDDAWVKRAVAWIVEVAGK